MKMVDVSVIIPCYNAEQFIQNTLDAIINQTRPPREIIVVDDGSSDKTLDILQLYKNKIKVISIENSGPSVARNIGIKAATSKYIAFCDADDIWVLDKLENQLHYFGKPFIFSASKNFSSFGTPNLVYQHPTPEMLSKKEGILLNNFVTTSSVLVLKSVLEEVGLFDKRFKCSEDWHLWIRIRRLYDFVYIRKPLVKYNLRPHSLSRNYINLFFQTKEVIEDIFSKYAQDFQIDKIDVLKKHCYSAACMAYYMKKYDESLRLLKELYKIQGVDFVLLRLFLKNYIRKLFKR